MCEFCVKHGEGKKWYLNTKNYSEDLLNDIKRRKFVTNFFYWIDGSYKRYYNFLNALPVNAPIIGPSLKAIIKRYFIYKNWGQVIPIEDIEKVLSITNSITRVPCVCRETTTGKEMRTCFLITLSPEHLGMADLVDQSFFGGPDVAKFEKVDKNNTLNFMKEYEKKGFFHSIWAHGTPYIGGICNCNATGCIPFNMYKDIIPIFFKAEYIAEADRNKCKGCKACIDICSFGALQYDVANKKVKIDAKKCYGCGICRTVCKENAIYLKNRQTLLEAAHLW